MNIPLQITTLSQKLQQVTVPSEPYLVSKKKYLALDVSSTIELEEAMHVVELVSGYGNEVAECQ